MAVCITGFGRVASQVSHLENRRTTNQSPAPSAAIRRQKVTTAKAARHQPSQPQEWRVMWSLTGMETLAKSIAGSLSDGRNRSPGQTEAGGECIPVLAT